MNTRPKDTPSRAPRNANLGRQYMVHMVNRTGKARTPDFFGIGAEKCGTTWIWQMFRDHPQIGVSVPKELRYFSSRYLGTGLSNFDALATLLAGKQQKKTLKHVQSGRLAAELRVALGGDAGYKRVFGCMSEPVVGEFSPQYCILPPEGIVHMARVAPKARIIMMLRDPVARAISGGKMKARDQDGALEEEDVRAHALHPVQIRMSRFSVILDRFEEAFPERVFVGFIDDIAAAPLELLADLCAFLGVEYSPDFFPRVDTVANEGQSFSVSDALKRELYGLLSDEYDRLETRFPDRVAGWRGQYEAL